MSGKDKWPILLEIPGYIRCYFDALKESSFLCTGRIGIFLPSVSFMLWACYFQAQALSLVIACMEPDFEL